ncbi:DsbA family protein [Cupriavidus basilensis]
MKSTKAMKAMKAPPPSQSRHANSGRRMPCCRLLLTRPDHVPGRAAAHVTVVEYGDFECQYCHLAYGGVKILLQPLPRPRALCVLSFPPLTAWHQLAEGAAEAAERPGVQHKFWPMHQQMFEQHHGLERRGAAAVRRRAGTGS